jgi:hypothetical protein
MNSVSNSACTHTPDISTQPPYVFLDKFDIILTFKLDKTLEIDEPLRIKIPKELQIFSKDELVIFESGICVIQSPSRGKRYASITGRRILNLIRSIPYKNGDNKYSLDDLDYCSQSFPDNMVYRFQLDFVKAAVEEIRIFLEKRFDTTVVIQKFDVTCIEFCNDSQLPPDPTEYHDRIYGAICNRFGFMKEQTIYGRKDSESVPRWLIRSDSGALWVKHYDNGETDRIELRHENPDITPNSIDESFTTLKQLGDLALSHIQILLTEAVKFKPSISVAKLKKKLRDEAGFTKQDFKSDWGRHLIFELTTSETYTPTKYLKDETAPKSKLERLSHPQCGIFDKGKVKDGNGSESHIVVYHLKKNWLELDMKGFKSRGANRKSLTPEALEQLCRAREQAAIRNLIISSSLWQEPNETDELVKTLRSITS